MNTEELQALAENAKNAESLLKAMSNANRLMILCSLVGQELTVSELNDRIPLSQSSLSQHLAALRAAGLVQTRRESQTIFYQLVGSNAIKIIETLKGIYCPPIKES